MHGPSFLGLAEDPKTEFHYLYEDEEPRSYAGLVFGLILLIGMGDLDTGSGSTTDSHLIG